MFVCFSHRHSSFSLCFNVFLFFFGCRSHFPPFSSRSEYPFAFDCFIACFVLLLHCLCMFVDSIVTISCALPSQSPAVCGLSNTCLLLKCFRSLVAVVGCVNCSLLLILVCSLFRIELPCVQPHALSLSSKGACLCALMKHNSRWSGNNKQNRKESLTSEGDRVDVLAVIADGHLGLTKTDRVLSGRDSIELLELSLINKLDGRTKVTQEE